MDSSDAQPVFSQGLWTAINRRAEAPPALDSTNSACTGEQVICAATGANPLRFAILDSAERLNSVLASKKIKRKSPGLPRGRPKKPRLDEDSTQAKEGILKPLTPTRAAKTPPKVLRKVANETTLPLSSPATPSRINIINSGKKRSAALAFSDHQEERQVEASGPAEISSDNAHDDLTKLPLLNDNSSPLHDTDSTDLGSEQPAPQNDDSSDLLGDEFSDCNDFLEVEKHLARSSPSTLPIMTTRTNHAVASPVSVSGNSVVFPVVDPQAPAPFMRSNLPPQPDARREAQDIPTLIGLLPANRVPTCFRIAEALRLMNTADQGRVFTFELFASIRPVQSPSTSTMAPLPPAAFLAATSTATSVDPNTPTTVDLADLFFPASSPYLTINVRNSSRSCAEFNRVPLDLNTNSNIVTSTLPTPSMPLNSSAGPPQPQIVRALLLAFPKQGGGNSTRPGLANNSNTSTKYDITSIGLWPATWALVNYTKQCVDNGEIAGAVLGSRPPPS